jgi:hypothetical protein
MSRTFRRVRDSSGFTVSDALTIGVLIANAVLAYLTLRTSKAAEHSAVAAEKGAAAADKQAAAATEQVRVAGEQVDTADRALAAQIQPVLVDEPLDLAKETRVDFPGLWQTAHAGTILLGTEPHQGTLSVPVRNMGHGPAQIVGVGLRLVSADGKRVEGPSCNEVTRWVLPVGESGRLNFWFTPQDLGPRWEAWQHTVQRYGNFNLNVRYRDLGNRGDYVSAFTIDRKENHVNAWRVRQIRLLTAEEAQAEDAA